MKRTLTEESVLFASVVKWFILATVNGLIVGLGATAFLKLLEWATNLTNQASYTYLFLPLAFFLSALLTKYLAPDAQGHGTEKVIEAIHKNRSIIPLAVVPVKLLATIITIAVGGSAGKEGPCAQIGAGLSSLFSRLFKFTERDRRKLVICGISAGFAAVFGTPIAGAIFGVEVLFVGSLLYDVLLPSFIAGITAYQVSAYFGVGHLTHQSIVLSNINEMVLLKVLLAAVIFGLLSMIFIKSMQSFRRLARKVKLWSPLKALIGGCALVLLTLLFGKQYLGLGLPSISSSLNGEMLPWFSSLLKILFTSITLNFGGSGGVVTPIFFIGSTAGSSLASILNMDTGMLAAIGFVCILAGAANTPIAASIMAVEMFGPSIGPYAAVACVVSYLINGHRSIYPSQIMAVKKSSSLYVEVGKEINRSKPSYRVRSRTMPGFIVARWKNISNKLRKNV